MLENELELKIKLSQEELEKVFRVMEGQVDVQVKRHVRHYYDTSDLAFYAQGCALRLEEKDGGWMQTVKFPVAESDDQEEGFVLRGECDDMLAGDTPDLSVVSDVRADVFFKPFEGNDLNVVFVSDIQRRYFVQNGVELAFDVGEMVVPSKDLRQPYVEIELELKDGDISAIHALKGEIMALVPEAQVGIRSKLDAGMALYNGIVDKY